MHHRQQQAADAHRAFQQAVHPQQAAGAVAQPAGYVTAQSQPGHERAQDGRDGQGGIAQDEPQQANESAFEDQAGGAGAQEAQEDDQGQPLGMRLRLAGHRGRLDLHSCHICTR